MCLTNISCEFTQMQTFSLNNNIFAIINQFNVNFFYVAVETDPTVIVPINPMTTDATTTSSSNTSTTTTEKSSTSTTTTAKPTQPSTTEPPTTTEPPKTTTTDAPSTTTVAPAPPAPVPAPDIGKWSYSKNNQTCLIVQMALQLNITYKTKGKQIELYIILDNLSLSMNLFSSIKKNSYSLFN